MGDDLTKVLSKLTEILTANSAEGAAAARAADGARAEGVPKLELTPNEIKLEGVSNYLSWSRRGLLLLKMKAVEGYVLGEVDEPADKKAVEWKKWSTTDSGILAWLLSSLTPSVAASVEALSASKEVWEALSQMYSGKGNVMLISQLEDRVHDLIQGEKSVMTYVGELKQLWADLDHLDPLVLAHSECVVAAKKWIEGRRVLKFLKGLDPNFENRRASLMHQTQLPSLEAAIAAITQEETRLKCNENGGFTQRPAYHVYEKQETRYCYNCGVSGHLSNQCTDPPRRGRGGFRGNRYNRGYYRGAPRGRYGGSYYHNSGGQQGGVRANMTVMEGDQSTLTLKQGSEPEREVKKGGQQGETSFGQFAHFVYTDKGNTENASLAAHKLDSDWILDSGASRHVTGSIREFELYNQYPSTYHETIQTADGTAQPVKGVGVVKCSSSINLSSVLYVPAFPVNLISMSCLVDQIDCRITVDKYMCLIQERRTGRKLGEGIRRRGLWHLDREKPEMLGYSVVLAAVQGDKETKAMIHHCRMGHISFDKMIRVFPDVMSGVDMSKLKCDACEYAKHTRSSYVSKGLRSIAPFTLVHSDVWTCPSISISGMKYFVTFIDCYTRMTWLYLLRHKDEVFQCFQDFCAYVNTQFKVQVQMLRSDNGTEYVNKRFGEFLSGKGIMHQTSCPDTPPQNGVAERKNRHILEVTRSLMYTMNVPKFLWGEAVLTATYLINRMPSRIIGMKSPCEVLFGENKFNVVPKVFGCTCFVRDHRPSVSKLDPKAVKCIFIGYPAGQQGYKCWNPTERRTFVSMDVTFRESEPFYGEQTDLSMLFEGLDHLSSSTDGQEGESTVIPTATSTERQSAPLMIGSVPITIPNSEIDGARTTAQQRGQEQPLRVYTRRRREVVEQGENAEKGEDNNPVPEEPHMQEEEQSSSATPDANSNVSEGSVDLPIALRKGTRAATSKSVDRYGFNAHDISNYVSYEGLSPSYRTFVASLQLVSTPTDWRVAQQDPKWCAAMREELEALRKNQTWELTDLPEGKRAVGCKWVFTIKQNPEGKIERYKARLVARGYSQVYGIDYDETFAPVAKMNTVRILISCAANFGWPLYQLDVKNAFLHGDLQEEVYMEVPPGMAAAGNGGKVCKLKKALYGLKQSPRAWLDRFRKVVCGMGYGQCNGDHTVFYKHSNHKITILAVYVDDIIITGDDETEIVRLKGCLSNTFEVKDLGQLKYFLGIEVARSTRGIALTQRKYVLDLLNETGMMHCRAAATPIDISYRITAESGELVEKENYQKLVGKLLYLCHTRPDIAFAVSIVSRYMHEPRTGHLDAVYRILRYLKGTPGKGLWFRSNGHLVIDGYSDADWASCLDDRRSTSGYCVFVGGNLVSWRSKKQPVVSKSTAEAEYRAMSQGLSDMLWVRNLLSELNVLKDGHLNVWCDNKSAICIANNPVQHDRTKHVEIDRFFIKEKIDAGIIKLDYVNTGQQIADCLTKGLGAKECNLACDKMGMIDIYHPS